jgi:tetratricopeptide (TPR) repeat protein
VLPTLPFFALTIGLGLVTAWLEKNHVGARGPDFDLSFPQRCIIAGHALWFYSAKLLWPAGLCFVYPRWQPDAGSLIQWIWPVTVAGLVLTLWLARSRIGRGPLTAVLFFIGALFPLLGFMNGYFMRYSFVCDHWAYFSSLGFIALMVALVARLASALGAPGALPGFAVVVLPALALLTWRQSAMYLDSKTLFQTTIDRNPEANLAHDNLGLILFQEGKADEAIAHFRRAVEIRPTSANAHNNLANALRQTGDFRGAREHYQTSLQLDPANPLTYGNLAWLLAACSDAAIRDGPKAVALAEKADRLSGGVNPVVIGTLAAAYAEAGRFPQAIASVQRALNAVATHPNGRLREMLKEQLTLYHAGLAFHEISAADAPASPNPPEGVPGQ